MNGEESLHFQLIFLFSKEIKCEKCRIIVPIFFYKNVKVADLSSSFSPFFSLQNSRFKQETQYISLPPLPCNPCLTYTTIHLQVGVGGEGGGISSYHFLGFFFLNA